MANLPVNAEFSDELRRLETSDPNHAELTFNPNFQTLINNDVYLKNESEKAFRRMEEFTKDQNADTGAGLLKFWTGTLTEYKALGAKNPATIYFVRGV